MSAGASTTGARAGAADDADRALIRSIWEQHRESVIERLDVVDGAIADHMTGELDEATRLQAEREAHTLAGAVGTLGFMRASENARAIELTLRAADRLAPDRVPLLCDLALSVAEMATRVSAPPDSGIS